MTTIQGSPSSCDTTHTAENDVVLEVKDLATHFFLDRGVVKAVDGVSFSVRRGHTLGILGESGCGKSVTARSIMRIVQPPGRTVGGSILFHRASGDRAAVVDLNKLTPHGPEMRSIRGCEIAMVFQEPMTFLNPLYTVGAQIMEAIILHQRVNKKEARALAIDMLASVRLPDPGEVVDRYPHQLSGGQRQRALIAMALSCHPSLLIADEPTTALDVTTEAQIIELMLDMQAELGMSIMYITHNLGVIAQMAEEVIVMYLGGVVEQASVEAIFNDPKHPYTRALLRSIPKIGLKSGERLEAIRGVVPDPLSLPSGCRFHNRCQQYMPGVCDRSEPSAADVGGGHLVSCFLYDGAGERGE